MSALRVLSALFDVDTAKAVTSLKQLDTGISAAKGALATLATSLVSAFALSSIKDFVEGQIAAAKEVRITAAKLGVGIEALEEFQFAAGSAGVSAEGAATSLKFLNKNLGQALEGNADAAQTFKELGVNLAAVKDGSLSATDVLPGIADKFQKMGSQAERTAAAVKIFGRQGADLLPLLEQGSENLQGLTDRFHELGGGMSEEFIAKAKEAGKAMSGLNFGLAALKRQIAIELFPAFTAYGNKLQKVIAWAISLGKETYIVKEGLALLGIVGAAAGVKVAAGWLKFFGLFPKGNMSIAKTLASMGWIGVIIAAVVALALVFEDLFIGIEGGQSVIKNWLQETLGVEDTDALFKQLGATIDQISMSFADMSPAVKSLVKMFAEILVSPYFVATIEFIVRLLGSMVALLIAAARAAGNIVTGDFEGAGKAIDQGGDAVFGKGGFFGDDALKPYAPRTPSVGAPGGGGGDTNNVEVTNNAKTTINVNGAGDPNEVGRRVASFQRDNENANAAALAALAVGSGGLF